jgi:chemotaxis protein MotB
MASGEASIIIKKVKKVVGGGHHGGAWKVAYADFVTAMMAFFLLMWLINTTSPEQKKGIADYFAPASVSETTSGAGGILGGTALGQDGTKQQGSRSALDNIAPDVAAKAASEQALKEAQAEKDKADFESAAQSLRQAMQAMPELAELSKQIQVDQTPEGTRIQLIDQEGRSMFDEGSAKPNPRAELMLRAVAKIVNNLPNRINVYGHTSLSPNGQPGVGDRGLSAARANAATDVMRAAGVNGDRVYLTGGKATSDPLYPDDPTLPGNRRIEIILLHEKPVLPPSNG